MSTARTAPSSRNALTQEDDRRSFPSGGVRRSLIARRRSAVRASCREYSASYSFRWRVRPKCAVGDSKFGTVENIMALEDEGIRASFPLADTEHRKGPYYPLAAFAYDAERDEYRCPQGQPLRRDRVVWEKDFVADFGTTLPTWGMAAAPAVDGIEFKPEIAKLLAYPQKKMDELGLFSPDWAYVNKERSGWIEKMSQIFVS